MVSGQRVLFVASEAMEFAELLRLAGNVRKLAWPVDWARSAELGTARIWTVAHGAGPARGGQAAEVGIAECRPQAVASTGYCGALDPALRVGDIIVGTRVTMGDSEFAAASPETSSPHARGEIRTMDRIIATAEEKAALYRGGAAAVEMEAGAVAQHALRHGIPFYCIKSPTDTAQESFALDLNGALRPDGHFGTIRVLTSALRNPRMALPELIRLRRSSRIATRKLGEFIAGCRF